MRSTNSTYASHWEFSDLYAWARRHFPILAVVVVAAALIFWSEVIATAFATERWNLQAFYAALFDWSSIQGAFLFGVYAFVLARSEPFIRAVAKTRAFDQARQYVRVSVYLSLGLTVLCIPMLISPLAMKPEQTLYGAGFVVFFGYALFGTYLLARFLKVLRVFRTLERDRSD